MNNNTTKLEVTCITTDLSKTTEKSVQSKNSVTFSQASPLGKRQSCWDNPNP